MPALAQGKKTGGQLTMNLPLLHEGQRIMLSQAKRFNIAICGRRWNKSSLAMRINVMGGLSGKPYLWAAPTYDQVRIGWEETYRAIGHIANFNLSTMTVTFPNGHKSIFRSMENPDNARGHTAHGLLLDEGAFISSDAYYQVLRPFVMDTGGPVWLFTTPNGLNWVYDEFISAQNQMGEPGSDVMCWQIPTVGCEIVDGKLVRKPHPLENPRIPFSEIENLFKTMPERMFRQEIMAEFLSDGGSVFNRVSNAIRKGDKTNEPYHDQYAYQMGVDLGRINDFTVISVVRLPDLRQVYWNRFNQISWERQIGEILRVAKQYNAHVVLDSGGVGDPIYQQLVGKGVAVKPFKWSNAAKQALVDHLAMTIEQSTSPWLMDIPVQRQELLAYQYEKTDAGRVTMNAPSGKHDDTVIALALSVHGQRRAESNMGSSQPLILNPVSEFAYMEW